MSRRKKLITPTRAVRTVAGVSLAVVVVSYAAKVIIGRKIEKDFQAERAEEDHELGPGKGIERGLLE